MAFTPEPMLRIEIVHFVEFAVIYVCEKKSDSSGIYKCIRESYSVLQNEKLCDYKLKLYIQCLKQNVICLHIYKCPMELIFYPDVAKCELYEMSDFDSRCWLRSGSHEKSMERRSMKRNLSQKTKRQ